MTLDVRSTPPKQLLKNGPIHQRRNGAISSSRPLNSSTQSERVLPSCYVENRASPSRKPAESSSTLIMDFISMRAWLLKCVVHKSRFLQRMLTEWWCKNRSEYVAP